MAFQRETILERAKLYTADIQIDLHSRIPALQRIVERWEFRGGTPREEFVRDALAYQNDLPGFQAIEWVDRDYFSRWVVPLFGNEQAVNLDLGFEENRRRALEKAKVGRIPVMSKPVDLVQGGKGFLVYFPIYVQGDFDGFVIAVFRAHDWLDGVLRVNEEYEHLTDVKFRVELAGVPVYQQRGWEDLKAGPFDTVVQRQLMGHQLIVRCRPMDIFFENTGNPLALAVIAIGVLLSLLVAFVLYFFQKANAEAWRTYSTQASLEKEIQERREAEGKLRQISSRLSLATKAGKVGVWTWDIQTDVLSWDELMYEIYDLPPDVVPKYETWKKALHPDDAEAAESLLEQAVQGTAPFDTEFRILTGDGGHKHVQAAAKVERNAEGEPLRVTGVNWDITERKHAAEELAAQRRRLASIIRGTNVGTWEWNVQTGETVFNERWANIVGYSLSEISPTTIETWMDFAHPDDLKVSGELLEKHFSGELEYYECEARMKHRNGDWIWVLDRGKVSTWTEDGKPLLMSGTHKDITEQKRNEEKIRHLATHDTLTDLPTLRLARDRIAMALATATRKKMVAAVMFVDLDGFKNVNDTLGHDAGDAVLKETAQRLLSCVRHVDTVARVGGDEFLIVLSELTSDRDAEKVASKVVAAIAAPYEFEEHQMKIGASVGIATCGAECGEIDMEILIKKADEAMYLIKKSGKSSYAFAQPEE
ncbi:diguanylate cyclase domain-containing protein [uncultured Pseudodesulfovibrio sp.]|uniref:diguanylate cyclase domain-containing protein n=1 Tax=uncultured Pseudodesulfovibrio sp. TaxID=2035858 RepID=UPI0029C6F025|nr:diguanylate cyclase [uncultured Pseudodesulfovibrio sp.]